MAGTERCEAGDWIEVERVLLDPADRSPNLPPETAEKPLMVWVKGFAAGAAGLGDEVTIETPTGRQVTGVLSAVNPGYTHTFGAPIPELQSVGRDLRARLAEWRMGGGAGVPDAGREASDAAVGGGELR